MTRMLAEKNIELRLYDLEGSHDLPPNIEFIQGDIRDNASIEEACRGVDVIYHNIAQVPLAKNKQLFWSVNVNGAENLFRSAINQNVKKVIYVSSSAVFGIPEKNPVDENMQPTPMESYGKAKYHAEKIAAEYVKRGLDITIIRPRTILGHGRLGIFSILFDWIRKGINVPVLGRGDNLYQFIHADDLASACFLASQLKGSDTYNIGAEIFGTMRELLNGLIQYAGSKSRVVSLPFKLTVALMKLTSISGLSPLGEYHSLMYGREMHFDISKPMKDLKWKPKFSNLEMICESYDWYCENYENISSENKKSKHSSILRKGILKIFEWL